MDLVSFDHRTKSIIIAIELFEKGFNNIIDCDSIKTIVVLENVFWNITTSYLKILLKIINIKM